MEFSIEKAKQGGIVKTRCGFEVKKIDYNSGIEDMPIAAVVMEVVTETDGRKRKRRLRKKLAKTHIEPCMTLYHADGRLHEDKDDDWDLIIEEEKP